MNPDTARERFSDAYEGDLDAEERRAFDAALAADPSLRAEFAAFEAAVGAARRLRTVATTPSRPLLPAVQRKLRRRSRGRYYRDRFAERAGSRTLFGLGVAAVLLLLGLALGLAATLASSPGPGRPITPGPSSGGGDR